MTAVETIVGVDLGGTRVRAGRVRDGKIQRSVSRKISGQESSGVVLGEVFGTIDEVVDRVVSGIDQDRARVRIASEIVGQATALDGAPPIASLSVCRYRTPTMNSDSSPSSSTRRSLGWTSPSNVPDTRRGFGLASCFRS